jgi:4-phospho-D-threonate 3-dehydrogenase / 4-phospho-D-erythronate 3-dehydrogenase
MPRLPRIALTVGDPAGVGPELVERALREPAVRAACEPVVYGPPGAARFAPGVLSAEAGLAAYDALVRAVEDARSGSVDAVTTAPVNKEAWALAGLPWRGHTDLLAHLTGAARVAMMFYSRPLRVVLATVHVALGEVPRLITRDGLVGLIRLAAAELPRFGFPEPRLGLAGLNPHAGEHGVIGAEDDAVLRPAVEDCQAEGIRVDGPFPADTLFVRAMRGEFDAVIACYHDQGLVPIKMVAFGQAVNVTLGLPIIRTSVDHGTAFDIAGTGRADPGSLIEAILLAARLAAHVHG